MTGSTTVLEPAVQRFADAGYLTQLAGAPAAHVIVIEAEPLRAEGEAYAGRHRATEIRATAPRYPGLHHSVGIHTTAAPAAIEPRNNVLDLTE